MRLVTRSDFDGLVCAMILKEINLIDDIKFVHPKDVQDGKIALTENDVTTNLPFDKRVGLAFDHHSSEGERLMEDYFSDKLIINPDARSTAEVVFRYYNRKFDLSRINPEIIEAVNKSDSADWTVDDIIHPTGWALLSFIMDARTGLGRFHDFSISNYELMMCLIDFCIDHTIEDVLALPDVKERIDAYFEQEVKFKEQLTRLVEIRGKVGVLDLREEPTIYVGNRFMIYAMFEGIEYSVHIVNGKGGENIAIMVGKSIINKEGSKDIGAICLGYGGGGHRNAGTCQVSLDESDLVIEEIVSKLNE